MSRITVSTRAISLWWEVFLTFPKDGPHPTDQLGKWPKGNDYQATVTEANIKTGWWLGHPSEKWWSSSIGMISNPILMGKCQKWPPNHQPENMGSLWIFNGFSIAIFASPGFLAHWIRPSVPHQLLHPLAASSRQGHWIWAWPEPVVMGDGSDRWVCKKKIYGIYGTPKYSHIIPISRCDRDIYGYIRVFCSPQWYGTPRYGNDMGDGIYGTPQYSPWLVELL